MLDQLEAEGSEVDLPNFSRLNASVQNLVRFLDLVRELIESIKEMIALNLGKACMLQYISLTLNEEPHSL